MKLIKLKNEKVEGDFAGKMMDSSHYDTILDEGDVRVLGPNDELVAVVKRGILPVEQLKHYWSILKRINLSTNNRGTASGEELKAKKASVNSGVLGYYPRYPRIPFCRECAWNMEHPEEFKQLIPLFSRVSDLHKELAPESWQLQKDWIEKTNPDFFIPSTIYTTVTINKNWRTASHLDAKNLYEGMASMLLLRSGQFSGGHVVLPEWRTAVKLGQGDLILFRNMKDFHGNTPIVPITKKHTRCTLVFYYREEMIKCGTAEQELARAKSGQDFSKDFSEERLCGNCEKAPCSDAERAACFAGGRQK